MTADRLSAIDATYLAIEDRRTPLHVASIGIFDRSGLCDPDGCVRLDEIRARIDGRLDLLSRLRQRPVNVPFGIARPVWIDDEAFDIVNHVEAVGLPAPYDESALIRYAEDLVMQPLERDHPLWHVMIVAGLSGDRVALIQRAHHALVDGVSGVDVSLVLLDTAPDTVDDARTSHWVPQRGPARPQLLLDGVRDRLAAPVEAAARVVAAGAIHPTQTARGLAAAARTVRSLRANGLRAPHSSLNRQVGARRNLTLIRTRLHAVRDAGARAGATVNDVVLTAVAGGLRELFLGRGETLPVDLELKVLVPVSVRTSEESMALGNRVGALITPLPVGIGDVHARLELVAATTKALKGSGEAASSAHLLHLADLLPQSLTTLLQRGIHHQPIVNLVVTNVPGPPFPLYALGARMLEAFPVVPLAGNMPLEVAVLSYDGALNLCVTSDATACPDVAAFVRGVEHAFGLLDATWTPVTV